MSDLTNSDVLNEFKSGRAGIENSNGTLSVDRLPDGTTALIGYGWATLAKQDTDGTITVYEGWAEWAQERLQREGKSGESTTKRHIRTLTQQLQEANRSFEVTSETPQAGSPPQSIREIGHLDMIPDRDSNNTDTEGGRTE